jgi:hypothetical protein
MLRPYGHLLISLGMILVWNACSRKSVEPPVIGNSYCVVVGQGKNYMYLRDYYHNRLKNHTNNDSNFYGKINGRFRIRPGGWDIFSDGGHMKVVQNNSIQLARSIPTDSLLRFFGNDLEERHDKKITHTNMLTDTALFSFVLSSLNAGEIKVVSKHYLFCELDAANFKSFLITSSPAYTHPGLNLLLFNQENVKSGTVYISGRTIGGISIHQQIERLEFFDCSIDSNGCAIDGANAPDFLLLSHLDFQDEEAKVDLQRLGYKEDFSNRTIGLIIEDQAYISHLSLDYTHFTLLPTSKLGKEENEWYSLNRNRFELMIENQRLSHNEKGRIKATIDLNVFEDRQKFGGEALVFIKGWWNNYGFEKERVVYGSLELFFFFFLINLIVFKKLRRTYRIDAVETAYLISQRERFLLKRALRIALLCLTYSAYIFWGLKLSLEKLNLSSLRLALWIICQYIAGLISLAYIANLIISK